MEKPSMLYSLLPRAAAAAGDDAEEPAALGGDWASVSYSEAPARVGVITALANVVQQLQQLVALHVLNAMNIWEMRHVGSKHVGDYLTRFRSNNTESNVMQAVRIADACIGDGPLTPVLEAAAAFPTLDDYGCWLLHHHPKLVTLCIDCGSGRWAMTWQRQQILYSGGSTSRAGGSLALPAATAEADSGSDVAPVVTDIDCHFNEISRATLRTHGMQPFYSEDTDLSEDFTCHMSRFSSRSVDILFSGILVYTVSSRMCIEQSFIAG